MIRFDRASKRYPNGREALNGASFEIRAGEMVFLTGRSGAGKSTVLKLIALLERPTRGLVMVNGCNTAALSSRRIPAFRRQLGVVFQDHRLLTERSITRAAERLHIAQPPLYKVARGKSETYLKDQRALEDYLIEQGLADEARAAGHSNRHSRTS